jgi:flagellar motor switch protein FliM
LVREHSRVLELAFETFARQWGTQLTANVRVLSQVNCEQVLMQTYDEYAAALPATTAMVLFSIEGLGASAVIQFSTSAALGWVAHMVGAVGPVVAPERKFTQVEQALLRRLMDDALEDLRYSLDSMLVADVSMDGVQYNSQFAQAAAAGDLMIVATFAIRVGDVVTPSTVAIPADALLPQLGEAHQTSLVTNARQLMRGQVAQVPIDLALQLSPAKVKPGAILDLAVGDILPIPHAQDRPLVLTIDGLPFGRAAAGSNGARLACIVVSTDS